MQSSQSADVRRYSLSLLRRLERYPRPDRVRPQRLDLDAWRELCREYGLTAADDDGAVIAAWGHLLGLIHPHSHARRPLATASTVATPGTAAKVEVMRQRADRGEKVFHPADAPLIQDRLVLIPGRERHNGRSQVQGVGEQTHQGMRRVA